MSKAEQFLKDKGLKDTLYNVNFNPNQNRGLPEKEWIKGGLSKLLEEYASQSKDEPIQFNVFLRGKLFGVEKLTNNGWESMCYDLNPNNGERWTTGVFIGEGFTRELKQIVNQPNT